MARSAATRPDRLGHGPGAGLRGAGSTRAGNPLSAANMNAHPRATLWHLAPGALLFLFAPLQFSRSLRARYPGVHRWNGRAMLALVALAGIAGMYLGLSRP